MSNIYSQNIIRKKNIELTIRKIFEIKQKTNEFNNVILNELSGYQDIFYLKNKKIFQFFLQKKKKQELDLLKNYEIIFITTNSNHDSLICLSNNGCIFSINYSSFKIKYFSNLDFNKFIIPNIITPKKSVFSFSQKNSSKNNLNNLNYIYNIFCNNTSDKVVLNLNKYILFWYQNNYNSENNMNKINNIDYNNKIEAVSGTIYSIIKEGEIEKLKLNKEINDLDKNNKDNININFNMNEYDIINEGVETIFAKNYFLGSHTRIFYVVLMNIKNNNNNAINKKIERKLYIFDYLFKFNYKNKFRCIPDTPKKDFLKHDLFNGVENEDLDDIKSKISYINITFNFFQNKNITMKKSEQNNNNNKQLLLKANNKGNVLAIIINDDLNDTRLLNLNSTLIFFTTETYCLSKKTIAEMIGKKILVNNPNNIYISQMEWICNDMFLLILTSKGYFFLINIHFQVIYITDISISLSNFDSYYIPVLIEKMNLNSNKKNDMNNLNLLVSKQREDLFIISDNNYIVCYQLNYKMYENKLINMEIPPENFQNFLFLLKYYQLYISDAQIDYFTQEEICSSVIDIMKKHLEGMFTNHEYIPVYNPNAEIIQTDTGIKIMKTKQNDEDEIKQESNFAEERKGNFDFFKNKQNNLSKNDIDNSLYVNSIKFIKIFRSINLSHEKSLSLISFIFNKSIDFLIHLMNNKDL